MVPMGDAVEPCELDVEVEQDCELFGWKREAVVTGAGRATPRLRGGPRHGTVGIHDSQCLGSTATMRMGGRARAVSRRAVRTSSQMSSGR